MADSRVFNMGAKSTIDITRSQALSFVLGFLGHADNQTLARLVEELNDELWEKHDFENSLGLHNFCVVEHTGDKEESYGF